MGEEGSSFEEQHVLAQSARHQGLDLAGDDEGAFAQQLIVDTRALDSAARFAEDGGGGVEDGHGFSFRWGKSVRVAVLETAI